MISLPPSTPILEALNRLAEANAITMEEREKFINTRPSACRTLGDLRAVLERGEITDAKLAAKLKKIIG